MAELGDLTKNRGYIRRRLTTVGNFLESFGDSGNIQQLKSRVPVLDTIFKDFHKVQFEIITVIDQTEDEVERNKLLDAHDKVAQSFETEYFNILSEIEIKIEASQRIPLITYHSDGSSSSNQAKSQNNSKSHIELPRYELPHFNGDLTKFMAFHDSFQSLIHNNPDLSDIQKFHFLKSCLKGDAARVIEPFVLSSANYQSAWQAVVKRFKNDRLMIQQHVLNMFKSADITKPLASALRQLLDDLTINLSALNVLGVDTVSWFVFLIPIFAEKLDFASKREWQVRLTSEVPELNEFTEFLEKRCQILESVQSINNKPFSNIRQSTATNKHKFKANYIEKSQSHVATTNKKVQCSFCQKGGHTVYQCEEFLRLSVPERFKTIEKLGLCANCLNSHALVGCKSSYKCKLCHKAHNTLIHMADEIKECSLAGPSSASFCSQLESESVLLSTAIVLLRNSKNQAQECRVLLDQGSQSHFITKRMYDQLGISSQNINMVVNGISGAANYISRAANVCLKSRCSEFKTEIKCLIVPKITNYLPNFKVNLEGIKIPNNIKLADPHFGNPGPIDMLIGAQLFWEILGSGNVHKGVNERGPYFQETSLGWIVGGPIYNNENNSKASTICNFTTALEEQVERFWVIDELQGNKPLSADERFCEKHFTDTINRDADGRFIAELPIRDNILNLGASGDIAIKRYYSLENKLGKNPTLKLEYSKFMEEYLHLDHMERVPANEVNKDNTCYLPHHAVLKQDSLTTKLRVVFDASCKTSNGKSLNDNLLAGPVIQQELFNILLRFRTFRYTLNADITKMYRQIQISPKQIEYQRIVWRDSKTEPLKHFRLKTLTYGTKPASFIATRCLKQLSDDNISAFPLACEIIKRDFYMDDLLTGCDTLEGAIQLRQDIVQILAQAKFELRKWSSNDPRTLVNVEDKSRNAVIEFENSADMKVLGVYWDCTQDVFKYRVKTQTISTTVTKRSILSAIAQMFDPLGYLAPIIIRGKILIQQLWANKLGWDEPVPDNLLSIWREILNEIHLISEIKIPRYVLSKFLASNIEIHGFCDSSERAYGAALYLRVITERGDITVKLLCAKSRVAPLKAISIPRLELCGALLLSRLFEKCTKSLNILVHRKIMWTDSTIVLAWLKSTSNTLKTFVANRVTEINELTTGCEWRHVNSESNPADIISRGLSPSEILHHDLWWSGPAWLSEDSCRWPRLEVELMKIDIPEKRTVNLVALIHEKTQDVDVFCKYSSFETLRRVISYCFRFLHNCKNKTKKRGDHLTTVELRQAENAIFKAIQAVEFKIEITHLKQGLAIKKGNLISLDPFLDSDGILRVGGRLRNACIPYDKTHPIILPKNHHITKLLIVREHERQLHAGAQATLASLRQNYWILSGRSAVRKSLLKCINCFKANPTAITQKMGDLPQHRLEPLRPFFKTGVDFAGPILIKESKGRGKRKIKAYIAVFICFATKAVHLELVGDLSAESFLNALRRLIGRRGHVAHLFSDNATNFTGAKNILSKLRTTHSSEFVELATKFHFIPPRSPNFGGLWEAAVRSVKKHLTRVIGDASLTYEEMYTYLVRVEACLNSRPLTPLSSDPNDLSVLTPGHFLIGEAMTAISEEDVLDININRLTRWQRIEQLRQHFWRRWSKEYLAQLQGRSKWHEKSRSELREGSLVIISDENLPPLQWPLGRIQKLRVGSDGISRVAVLKTTHGEVTRSVRKLCLMPA